MNTFREANMEQEIASIIKFVLAEAGNPTPYYDEVPQDFFIPSVFFPVPELDTDGETFKTYRIRFSWFIKFFHRTTPEAYDMAMAVLTALKRARNLVPLIDTDGTETGEKLRLRDPRAKKIDSGVCQLMLEWDSRRPYDLPDYETMQNHYISGIISGMQPPEPAEPDPEENNEEQEET